MVYVLLAEGFEEVEALTPVDLLRRSKVETKIVGVTGMAVTGSHGITVQADISIEDITDWSAADMIVLPGGMPGTLNLEKSEYVQKAIDYCVQNNRYIGAICAAPSILGHKGLLKGKKAVCYTGFEAQLEGAEIINAPVAVDGNIITARGAGAAVKFGLALVEMAVSKAESDRQFKAILCD